MKLYFGLVGAIFLLLAVWELVRRLRVQFWGVSTTGIVGGHVVEEMDGTEHRRFTIAYYDANDTMHELTSVAGMRSKLANEGTKVVVRYLPANPKLAYITGFLHMWAIIVVLLILGTAGVAVWWSP